MAKTRRKAKEALPSWDLTEYYSGIDDPRIARDLKKAEHLAATFKEKYEAKIADASRDVIAQAMSQRATLQHVYLNAYNYLYRLSTLHRDDAAITASLEQAEKVKDAIKRRLDFFGEELFAIGEEAYQEHFKDSPLLQKWKPEIDKIRRLVPYRMPVESEERASRRALTTRYSSDITALWDEEEKRETAIQQGKKETPEAKAEHKAQFAEKLEIYALLLNGIIASHQRQAEMCNLDHYRDIALLQNWVEPEVMDVMLNTIKASVPNTVHRYYALKHPDDSEPKPDAKCYTWEEAKDIVLSAFRGFSPEMAEIAEMFFAKGWIDAAPSDGKVDYSYCQQGAPGEHPHILLNFTGKLVDLAYMAHELGHGVHQYLEKEQIPYSIQEMASTFGEALLSEKLMQLATTPSERRQLLGEKIDNQIDMITSSVSHLDFESRMYDARKKGELTANQYSDMWEAAQCEHYGYKPSQFREGSRDYWIYSAYLFEAPFEIGFYSFGNLLANNLQLHRQQGDMQGFDQAYLEMLGKSGTTHSSELFAPFGFDLRDPNFWQRGMDVLAADIAEYEKLLEEEKTWKAEQAANDNGRVRVKSAKVVGADTHSKEPAKSR